MKRDWWFSLEHHGVGSCTELVLVSLSPKHWETVVALVPPGTIPSVSSRLSFSLLLSLSATLSSSISLSISWLASLLSTKSSSILVSLLSLVSCLMTFWLLVSPGYRSLGWRGQLVGARPGSGARPAKYFTYLLLLSNLQKLCFWTQPGSSQN